VTVRDFSLFQNVQTGNGATQFPVQWVRGLSAWGRSGRTTSTSVEVKASGGALAGCTLMASQRLLCFTCVWANIRNVASRRILPLLFLFSCLVAPSASRSCCRSLSFTCDYNALAASDCL
jgi:hypothetical protein